MSATRIVCLTRAVTRITHMAGTAGNEAIIAREPVTDAAGERRHVPCLSANALRNVCVRTPGMTWLAEEYGLRGALPLAALNVLLHGGALQDSTGREPTARVAEMHEAWPLLKLLGGALPDQILSGTLRAGPGILVCEENRARLDAILGADVLDGLPPLLPGESFVESYQYTTYDARQHQAAMAESASDFAASESDVRMLYTGQCVRAGAMFAHEFIVLDPLGCDVGALLWSLELWHRGGGVVGGMGAKGHGRTECVVLADDVPAHVAAYLSHARAMRGRAVAWLDGQYKKPPRPEKPAKGRRKAKAAEADTPAVGDAP